jgi:hypothetical protein
VSAGARRNKQLRGNLLVAQAVSDQTYHITFRWRQRAPTACRALALASAPARIPDCFLARKRGALTPETIKSSLPQGISNHRKRGVVVSLIHRKADVANALPHAVRRAQQTRRISKVAIVGCQTRKAFQSVVDP